MKSEKEISFLLRKYRVGDEEGMIACIREEYGETYFKKDFYEPQYLRKKAEHGEITFLIAEISGEKIVGMMILKQFFPEETMCEIASQIIRKEYRGYGLAMQFFRYGMTILLEGNYSAAYCLPVLFHDTTQRLLRRLGLVAAGFILNVFDMETVHHSYYRDRNSKHSQGIQIKAVKKKEVGELFLPKEHREFCEKIYNQLGVAYRLNRSQYENTTIPSESKITWKLDSIQSSVEIRVHQIGNDFEKQIKQIHTKLPLIGKQTANLFLNTNDSQGIWAYRKLQKMGYFFTGLKPLCSEVEFLVMHHPGEVCIYFDDYILSTEFAEVCSYVKKCYEEGL